MFNKIKITNKILLNNYNREYIIQGICIVDNTYLITSYSKTKDSIISIYDFNYIFIKEIKLYNNSHVGGICFDSKNNIIWITDEDGTISGYNKDDIYNKDTLYPIKTHKQLEVGKDLINYKNKPSVAYLTYDNNKLYLGNFCTKTNSELRSYEINEKGLLNLNSIVNEIPKFNKCIQGVTIYKNYLLVSRSKGRYHKSELDIYDKGTYKILKKIKINIPMIEQLIINSNKLIITSESGSVNYLGLKGTDIIEIDLNTLNLT